MGDFLLFSCARQAEAEAHAARYANVVRADGLDAAGEVVVRRLDDGSAWGVYRREVPASGAEPTGQ